MGTWRLTTDGVTFYPAFDIKVMKQISGLNMIQKVSSIGSGYTNDTVVRLIDPNDIEVFRGYITRVAPPEDDDDTIEDFEVQEMAKELKDTMITDGADYSVTWASSANIDLILLAMLSYSSPLWSHPDSDTTDLGTDITFESMSMLDGIYKICRQMRGHIVWFDGVNRNVRFGSSRTDRTGTPITSWIKKKTVIDTAMSNVDEVVVYGTDKSISGSYGTSGGITKAYQVLSLVNSIECTNVATQIFNQLSVPKKQIRVLMEYNDIYDEGDLVRVGVDTTDYVVYEVVLSENETWLGLNSATESIFDAQPMVGVSEGSGDDTEGAINTILGNAEGIEGQSFGSGIAEWFNSLLSQTTGDNNGSIDHITLSNLNSSAYKHMVGGQDAIRYLISDPITSTRTGELVINNTDLTMFFNKGTSGTPNWCQVNFTKDKLDSLNDPTVNDDVNDGYSIGSMWVNESANIVYFCVDSSAGAAIWVTTSGGSGDFLADGSVPMTGNLDMNTKILLDAYVNGTNGTGFIIDQDNVGAAVDTSITFERGVSTNSTIDCSGATGSITLVTGGGGELYVSATTLTTKANVLILDSDYDSTDISIRMQRTVSTYASMFWDESDAEMKFYSDGATNALANIKCASIKAQAGIILDADETTPKTKIFDEGSTGTKNMVFEVKTGQSFVFRTVA